MLTDFKGYIYNSLSAYPEPVRNRVADLFFNSFIDFYYGSFEDGKRASLLVTQRSKTIHFSYDFSKNI